MSFFLALMVLAATYNIYKSGTRTVFIGLAVYALTWFLANRKYVLLTVSLFTGTLFVILSGTLKSIFFDVYEPLVGKGKIESMGSGRVGGWDSMIEQFFSSPITEQILGRGSSIKSALTGTTSFGGSHNDFLDVLFCFGYIGLTLYLMIIFGFLFGILNSRIDRKLKYMFLGLLLSVIIMNGLSNSYLARFELSQYFMLCMGLFYCLKQRKVVTKSAEI